MEDPQTNPYQPPAELPPSAPPIVVSPAPATVLKVETAMYVIWFALMACIPTSISYLIYFALLARARAQQADAESIAYFVPGTFTTLTVVVLSMAVCGLMAILLGRGLVRRRWLKVAREEEVLNNLDQQMRMTVGFSKWIVPLTVVLLLIMYDFYIVLDRDKITYNPYFGFKRTYSYDDVTAVETAPAIINMFGSRIEGRRYEVHFKDGTKLDPARMWLRDLADGDPVELIETISERSGVDFHEVESFDGRLF